MELLPRGLPTSQSFRGEGEGKVHAGVVEPSTVRVGVPTATAMCRGAEQLPICKSASAMQAAISRSDSIRSGKSSEPAGQRRDNS